jgi:hydrogenase expression/formation protein HypE
LSALGKLPASDLERLILGGLGAARAEVLVGPRAGVDCAIVRVGPGRVMAVTTDPLSLVPALGPERSARLSCHLLASDLWTSGIPPAYATIDLNLPPHLSDVDLEAWWRAMSDEWTRLEVAVIGGHTGRYEGCDLSIIGSGTLIGVGDEGRTVGPSHVVPGDRVLVTKGAAIETSTIAAAAFPERLARHLDPEMVARAGADFRAASVVADCRAALRVGVRDRGVSSLHDATEGGILGALVEVARASGHDLRIELAKVPVSVEARAACAMFEIDPYVALSEGALIVTVRPPHAEAVIAALAEEKIPCANLGEVVRGHGTVWLTGLDGGVRQVKEPPVDPYWEAYGRAMREGWK